MLIPDPKHPGKHIDTETGIWPISEWGPECGRGFVRNARFGGGRVIEGTNRQKTRQWYRLQRQDTPQSSEPAEVLPDMPKAETD